MSKRLSLGLLVSAALVTGSLLSPAFAEDSATKPTDAAAANAVSDASEPAKSAATDEVAMKAADRLLGYAKTTARRNARHHPRRVAAYRASTRVAWIEPVVRPFYRNVIFLGVGF